MEFPAHQADLKPSLRPDLPAISHTPPTTVHNWKPDVLTIAGTVMSPLFCGADATARWSGAVVTLSYLYIMHTHEAFHMASHEAF